MDPTSEPSNTPSFAYDDAYTQKRIMMAHARGSSEDNSGKFFRVCQGLHRIEGNLGPVEELYCGNSTINPRLCEEAESVPGPAPTCAAATRP